MYCSCSIRALTSSVVHTVPWGMSPDMSMIPAPVMPVTLGAYLAQPLRLEPERAAPGQLGENPESTFSGHRFKASAFGKLQVVLLDGSATNEALPGSRASLLASGR